MNPGPSLWWQDSSQRGSLGGLVGSVNASRRVSDPVDQCNELLPSLAAFAKDRARLREQLTRNQEGENLRRLVQEAQSMSSGFMLQQSVSELAALRPMVANCTVRSGSRDAHQKLERSLSRRNRNTQDLEQAAHQLGSLLWVIRNNIVHREKVRKATGKWHERDYSVCRVASPVLYDLLEIILETPNSKLVAYGTLRPGECNADVVERSDITWEPCTIRGKLLERDALPFLMYDDHSTVEAVLGFGGDGPFNWECLDHFEGQAYRRELTIAEVGGVLHVGNVYMSADAR